VGNRRSGLLSFKFDAGQSTLQGKSSTLGRGYRKLGRHMIKFFSRLPLRALYAFSSFLYLLAFYVVRHRHQVIRGQLERSFPMPATPSARASPSDS